MKLQKLVLILASILLFAFASNPVLIARDWDNAEQLQEQLVQAFTQLKAQHPDDNNNQKQMLLQVMNGESVIKGHVKDEQGSPLNAYVFYWSTNINETMSGTVATGADGYYEITGLSAGTYFLAGVANGFLIEFYENTSDFTQISPIQLGDAETFVADFSLASSTRGNGSISGMIKSEGDLQPIANAWVMAVGIANPQENVYFATTDQNGLYQFTGLPFGIYGLYAQAEGYIPEYYDNAQKLINAKPVIVQNLPVTGKDFLLTRGGSIAGTVKDGDDVAIEGVKVSAFVQDFQEIVGIPFLSLRWPVATTDENGAYKITGLKDGNYLVSAALIPDKGAPLVMFWENTYDYDKATLVEITNGANITGIDFKFENTNPTGAISGTVEDVEGNPLPGIWITVWASFDSVFFGYFGHWNYIETNEKGEYRIDNLWPGEYIVSATRWQWWDYETIYYDGVEELADATPVKVENDVVTENINFVFEKGRELGSISGTVTSDNDASPISYALVEAIPVDPLVTLPNIRPVPAMIGFTDENGKYLLKDLVEGDYIVAVTKSGYVEYYDNVKNMDDATKVTVTGGDEKSNINFAIPPVPETGSRISGKVTDNDTGDPIAGAIVSVCSTSPFGRAIGFADIYITATEADGNYIVGGIPAGEYIVTGWARGYIAEFFDDTMNPFRAEKIKLDGSDVRTGVDFALTPGTLFDFFTAEGSEARGSISGIVKNSSSQGISGAYVYAYDENNNVLASEMTGSDGRYALSGLPNGNYDITVSRMPYETESTDTPVTVGNQGTWDVTNVDFTLAPATYTSVPDDNAHSAPERFALYQNYPNPFNPTTTIWYALPKSSHVTLQIINLQGQVVRTLVDGSRSARVHQVTWDGNNDQGQRIASGIYLYRLQAGDISKTMRLILLK